MGTSRKRSAALLREGRVEEAARVLFDVGLNLEAAELLADHGRYNDAVLVLVGSREPDAMKRLDEALWPDLARFLEGALRYEEAARVQRWIGAGRSRALLARAEAADFSGPDSRAGLGSRSSAPPGRQRTSTVPRSRSSVPPSQDARGPNASWLAQKVARAEQDGRLEDAAAYQIELGDHLAAARNLHEHGSSERALRSLLRVPRSAPEYREACIFAIDLAVSLDIVDFDFDQFIGAFMRHGARTRDDLAALLRAAELYERNGFVESARAAFARILAVDPSYRDAHQRMSRLADVRRSDPPRATVAPSPSEPPGLDVYELAPGYVVAERYQIDAQLGRGGMAAVYSAFDLELGERIAIKIFAGTQQDAATVARFKRELALARQLSHPNIVRVYDIGSHGSVRFITMELLHGKDLADVVEESRDMMRDLGYLIEACAGLQCAHERGVVHRDLKPENIFITSDGGVKLMDFGIAKRQSSQDGSITQAGFSAGTPAYMAPEQINDFRSATHLSDLYSMGVIAYRLFTGELPFKHDNPVALLMKHLNDAPELPSTHNAAIPDELEFIILQLLEKDPALRVQSCRDLAADLDALSKRLGSTRRRR